MPNDNVKEQLIQATMKLLTEKSSSRNITVRQIAAQAKVNLAMINYYFDSKDELINQAATRIIQNRADTLENIMAKKIPSRQKLLEYLVTMSDITIEYSDITRACIPYLLLEGEIELPYYILPIIRECFDNRKSETDCRVMAYQIMSFLQLVLYRSSDFLKYSGIDIMNKEQRDKSLQEMIDSLIRE